ncbi:hypothetical protein EIN_530280 [Entamoeba invadens IP1]|uniref:DDE-1 domain-containing protein n=1 Tax=Entamoeba invadens IP1 TaxID=370355 RepID=L7FLL5_ENTIV|nr:hypothetical protein EIN_530280 [Entamoeba invadens IP1]ELP88708.1 hypothetical protein EIN_530280 [Entamoeba invadens IP1]|eukprot:XP_004255479.1 hypothetical protein EIN_530280 [Entamoeba invadens IP1]
MVTGKHASLIYNLDEVGFDLFVDGKKKAVCVDTLSGEAVYTTLGERGDRITLLGCICADGKPTKPMVITFRLQLDGNVLININSSAVVVTQKVGFINSEFFFEWVEKILVPDVKRKRKELKLKREKAILIMDGFKTHSTVRVLDLLKRNRIDVLFLVPHSSHICQHCDLCLFSSLKAHLAKDELIDIEMGLLGTSESFFISSDLFSDLVNKRQNMRLFAMSKIERRIVCIVDSFFAKARPEIIKSFFEQAGIVLTRKEHKEGSSICGFQSDSLVPIAKCDFTHARRLKKFLGNDIFVEEFAEKVGSIERISLETKDQRKKRLSKKDKDE